MAEPPYTGPPPSGIHRAPPQPPPPYWGPPYWGPPNWGPPYPPPYPRPDEAPSRSRPAGVLAAAVLGWIAAGMLLLAAGLLFFGAAFLHDIESATSARDAYVAEFTFDAFLDLLAAGLLVAGGAGLMNRAAAGRLLLSGGCAILVVDGVYWLIRWTSRTGGTVVGYAVLFAALGLAAAACAWSRPVTNWLNQR